MSAYLPEVFLPGAWNAWSLPCNSLGTATGPTGREIGAQGFGHRPMPWVTGDRSTPRPEGPREVLFETAPLAGEGSRGPSGRMIVAAVGSQGIGLRPHPWALFSRPVGPERTAVSRGEGRARLRGPRADRVEGAVSLPPQDRGDVVLVQREVRRRHDRIDLFRAPEADDGPVHGRVAEGTLRQPRAQIGVGPGPWAELA